MFSKIYYIYWCYICRYLKLVYSRTYYFITLNRILEIGVNKFHIAQNRALLYRFHFYKLFVHVSYFFNLK